MNVFWFIPTYGDGRYIGTDKGARTTSLTYYKQIAMAADELGYAGVLLPTGRSCEDSWVLASMLAAATKTLKFLVAVRPGLMSPALAARMASTFDRHSEGRLLINVVAGGDPEELEADGLFLSHSERYELTDEFMQVWRGLLREERVSASTIRNLDSCAIIFFVYRKRPAGRRGAARLALCLLLPPLWCCLVS
jgi:alkanesulfonate monooxygenase